MKIFFFLLALFAAFSACTQTKGSAKLYGYIQQVSGGARPDPSAEPGTANGSNGGKNYFLYVASKARLYASEIWVEGNRYGVTTKAIGQTPVEHNDEMIPGSPRKVLVPKTGSKVVQLILRPAGASKSVGSKARSLAAVNEVVLVYKEGSKFYYNTLGKLSALDAAAMQ